MIKNLPEAKNQHIEDMRGAFEHRATWMYLMYKEAKKEGLSDEFAHRAILECGRFHGENKYTQTEDLHVFHKEFINDHTHKCGLSSLISSA